MSGRGTGRQPEVLVHLIRGQGSLHGQIEQALRDAARTGRLAPGAPLPSTRVLARDLGVSRGVVVEAYDQLTAEGYLETRAGSRTVVARSVRSSLPDPPETVGERLRFDFRPGLPDLARFPREEWVRASRRVLRTVRPHQLDYADWRGTAELRFALAEYLGRVRGVTCSPQRVIVCSGFTQALGVAARGLARLKIRRIAVEDPCQPDERRIVAEAGLVPVPVPVDAQGIDVEALEQTRVRAVLVSPAHQFPTGSVLSAERRRALLAWAEHRAAFVIEDDYDAEYRYDRAPVGALQGLDPERVVYAGSASKILAPALRLGWLVVPPALLEAASEAKKLADLGTSFVEQLVYADFLREGSLDRHLRRMRGLYRVRRDALLGALADRCPSWTPHGAAAGLHVIVALPAGSDESAVVAAAARRSVRLYPAGHYAADPASAPPAVVMGYACLSEREITAGVARLAR